jgi:hypothetical protein
MKDSLKKILEGLVEEEIKTLEENKAGIKRIVLFSSEKFTDFMREVLNYTENCMLSTQFKIDHREIRIEIIPWYNRNRHFREGDYAIDLGAYLKPNFQEFF